LAVFIHEMVERLDLRQFEEEDSAEHGRSAQTKLAARPDRR
jgi:hypothetical protein